MSVITDCELVVAGPAAEIRRWEERLTRDTIRAVEGGATGWGGGGWPSLEVRRALPSTPDHAVYGFEVRNTDPCLWAEGASAGWPELDLRATCILDDQERDCVGIVHREWFRDGETVRHEAVPHSEGLRWWRTARPRWRAEAGVPEIERLTWAGVIDLRQRFEEVQAAAGAAG